MRISNLFKISNIVEKHTNDSSHRLLDSVDGNYMNSTNDNIDFDYNINSNIGSTYIHTLPHILKLEFNRIFLIIATMTIGWRYISIIF